MFSLLVKCRSYDRAVDVVKKAKALPFVMGATKYITNHSFYNVMVYGYAQLTDEQIEEIKSLNGKVSDSNR